MNCHVKSCDFGVLSCYAVGCLAPFLETFSQIPHLFPTTPHHPPPTHPNSIKCLHIAQVQLGTRKPTRSVSSPGTSSAHSPHRPTFVLLASCTPAPWINEAYRMTSSPNATLQSHPITLIFIKISFSFYVYVCLRFIALLYCHYKHIYNFYEFSFSKSKPPIGYYMALKQDLSTVNRDISNRARRAQPLL